MKPHNPKGLFYLFAACLAGLFAVQQARADSGPEHQVPQAWPIQLGTSGGNINDWSARYCCSGTLGALVQDSAGVLYILSNNHVLARANQGALGEEVNQPGMVDQNCGQAGVVAELANFVPIQFGSKGKKPINYVDAAMAQIRIDPATGTLAADGTILDIGTLSAETLVDTLKLAVCKSGRTTGFTTGTISMVDVTVSVGYSQSCGGRASLTATFADQMVIKTAKRAPVFSAAGDSGSLIVESLPAGSTTPPRAVGLLFAGNSTQTIANPINRVLSGLGVTMVGGVAQGAPPGGGAVLAGHALDAIKVVKGRHGEKLMAVPGVHGHGIGLSQEGKLVIQVLVTKEQPAEARGQIPDQLEDVAVEIVVTEPFVAY